MEVTLQDIFFTAGSITFILISVTLLFVLFALARLFVKMREALEKGEALIEDAKRTQHTIEYGILRIIIKLLGGEK